VLEGPGVFTGAEGRRRAGGAGAIVPIECVGSMKLG
jgi:hypothetical protein